jgi:hypothetical protein
VREGDVAVLWKLDRNVLHVVLETVKALTQRGVTPIAD